MHSSHGEGCHAVLSCSALTSLVCMQAWALTYIGHIMYNYLAEQVQANLNVSCNAKQRCVAGLVLQQIVFS